MNKKNVKWIPFVPDCAWTSELNAQQHTGRWGPLTRKPSWSTECYRPRRAGSRAREVEQRPFIGYQGNAEIVKNETYQSVSGNTSHPPYPALKDEVDNPVDKRDNNAQHWNYIHGQTHGDLEKKSFNEINKIRKWYKMWNIKLNCCLPTSFLDGYTSV